MRQALWRARSALGIFSLLGACACAPTLPTLPCVYSPIERAAAGAAPYRYQANAGPGAAELCVEVSLPRGTTRLRALPRITPFIRDVEVAYGTSGAWTVSSTDASGWALSGCAAAGCRARYRFSIAAAAQSLGDEDLAR